MSVKAKARTTGGKGHARRGVLRAVYRDDDSVSLPELKDAMDSLRANLGEWKKSQDVILQHWGGEVQRRARAIYQLAWFFDSRWGDLISTVKNAGIESAPHIENN
jgi:hypothetical protein